MKTAAKIAKETRSSSVHGRTRAALPRREGGRLTRPISADRNGFSLVVREGKEISNGNHRSRSDLSALHVQ